MNTSVSQQRMLIKKSTVSPTSWDSINWNKIQRYVEKLQQRIYHAESCGNKRKVRDLQRLLMRSEAALLLSIRQTTQINKGKRTAGVDGYKALTERERMALYNKMKNMNIMCHNPKPAYRTYIKKKNGKLRPLGIPTIKDRVYQNIAKLALEPQWEARFEPSSYGFRPKRSCHDAITAIHSKIAKANSKKQWIFEGDFRGCFDNLNHSYIMEQIKEFPANNIIKRWLKAGFVDNGVFNKTEFGTPQGGIISPLLANIALHGMEAELGITYKKLNKKRDGVVYENQGTKAVVRYADDFVVICSSKEEAESIYKRIRPYLDKRGLELAEDKTKITHIDEGFDFLGFNVRRYKITTSKSGYKVLIKPSKESIKRAKKTLSETAKSVRGNNVGVLIDKLNPIILGTANYWSTQVSSEVFSTMDNHIFKVQYKILKGLHPTKSWKWKKGKYYKPDRYGQSKNKWILTDTITGKQLTMFSWRPIVRHELIKFNNSPFDKSLKNYFKRRDIREFERDNVALRQKLAKKQNYKCPLCGYSIIDGREGLERHHKIPKIKGGNDTIKNQQLVHISCHIDHHRLHPAKGTLPTEVQLRAEKKWRVKGGRVIRK
ncbi:group II intron reverse transcriptase/maturase [Clostridium magnum]|uniref:Group II intron-encoded protein LtrA n=1 Tax=Clostridium magnum DSM 2767 TaxID=1121326 RepID=A0A162QSN8_9CLOT|nr:group II intron reverse transcriptase/maturase [Clostridium magnum]KZL88914.1 group II intron-encoded protein LtrA [Clostridium magnum DSM 2767]SHI53144.1 RNA-directed DNA polymerase [Clostridium magnum DSM 2767]